VFSNEYTVKYVMNDLNVHQESNVEEEEEDGQKQATGHGPEGSSSILQGKCHYR
jgi:hypothetical protein